MASTKNCKWRKWDSSNCLIPRYGLINKQKIRSLSGDGDNTKCHGGWGATTSTMWCQGMGTTNVISKQLPNISLPNSEIMSSIVTWINTIRALNVCWDWIVSSKSRYAHIVDTVTKANQNPLTFNIQLSDVIPFPIPIPVNIKYLSSDTCTMHRHYLLKELIVTSC